MFKKLLYSFSAIALVSGSLFAQQPPQAGFEDWTSQPFPLSYKEPIGWATTNSSRALAAYQSVPMGSWPSVSVFPAVAPNIFSGDTAMRIVSGIQYAPVITSSFLNDTAGFAWVGSVIPSSPYIINGYQNTTRFAQFDFHAKYIPYTTNGDSAFCIVVFFKRNGLGTGNRDTVAVGGKWITSTPNYANFTVNMMYKPNTFYAPDTASIIFSATNAAQPKVGSELYIDDIAFSGFVGIHENSLQTNTLALFPNPANDAVTITSSANNFALLEVYDVAGRKVDSQVVNNNKIRVDVSTFSKGLYSYNAYNDKRELVGVGKFSVAR